MNKSILILIIFLYANSLFAGGEIYYNTDGDGDWEIETHWVGDATSYPGTTITTSKTYITINNDTWLDAPLNFNNGVTLIVKSGASLILMKGLNEDGGSGNKITIVVEVGGTVTGFKKPYGPTVNENLPVSLIYFNTFKDKTTKINWSTASETNNDYFLIEKSSDLQNWKELAKIMGAGTSSIKHDYVFKDESTNNGTIYYRLIQVDYDGTTTIYGPISSQRSSVGSNKLIVSQSTDGEIIKINQTGLIKIYNTSMQLVKETKTEEPNIEIPLYNLSDGIYFVSVETEFSIFSSKLRKL